MIFKRLEQLVKELEKITGDKWELGKTSSANNESLTRIENSIFSLTECELEAFGGLPQTKELSLADFKHYIKTSGRDLNYVKLVQEVILYHHNRKTNKTYFEYIVKREFPLDTKLDDGSLLIDNLENFKWKFEWKKGCISGDHYIPSGAFVSIKAEPSKKILKYMDNRPIANRELIATTHHADVYVILQELGKQALSNINHTDNKEIIKK